MIDSGKSNDFHQFGSGLFEFEQWATPFTNAAVEILEVVYSPNRPWPEDARPHYRSNSLLRTHNDADLVARIYVYESKNIYRVTFNSISAMRLLDEGGLLEFWLKTEELGGRPGQTTFRVRNHGWAEESLISFLETDGWSFVIASENECLEVVSAETPEITKELCERS